MIKRVALLFLLNCSLFGQTSYYSTYGFGLPSPAISARYLALGQTGIAIPDSISLNISNPALWDGFMTTSVQGQLSASTFSTSSGLPGATLSQFLGFSFKFPIGKDAGFAMGITPYSRMKGDLSISDSTEFFDSMVNYSSEVGVEGGISEFFLGAGYRISSRLSLGLKTRLFFGSYLTRMATDVDDDGSVNSYYRKYEVTRGSLLELGTYWISQDRKLELGATYTQNLNFNYYRHFDYYFGDDTTMAAQSLKFPTTFQFGMRRKLGESLAFSADLAYSLVSSSLFNEFNIVNTSSTQNPIYIGVGLERQPTSKLNASYWQKMALRTGAFYKTEAVYQSDKLTETGVSFGIGVPFNHYSNRIDLAVVASIRDGFLSDTIGQEKLLSFYASVTTGELWFKRFKRF
ncbi:MAG: hypothetical protein JXR87_03735 [Candidatus Marinimicrobia bacterium]|nr:hypothetical protein [Candidatus Neomarinimicrobiota bacterium]